MSTEPEHMKLHTFKIEPSLLEALREDAAQRGEGIGEWIRKACRRRLSKEVRDTLPESRGPGRPPKPPES